MVGPALPRLCPPYARHRNHAVILRCASSSTRLEGWPRVLRRTPSFETPLRGSSGSRFLLLHGPYGTALVSLLPERAHQLVAQRLDQVGQHGAVAGLHEGFDRHARDQLDLAEPR